MDPTPLLYDPVGRAMLRAFGREWPALCRFLPAALAGDSAEIDEVDIDIHAPVNS